MPGPPTHFVQGLDVCTVDNAGQIRRKNPGKGCLREDWTTSACAFWVLFKFAQELNCTWKTGN